MMRNKPRLSNSLFKIILHNIVGHCWQKDFWIAEDSGRVNAYKCSCSAYVVQIGDDEVPEKFDLPTSYKISGEIVHLCQFVPHCNGSIYQYRSKAHKLSVEIGILLQLIKKDLARCFGY